MIPVGSSRDIKTVKRKGFQKRKVGKNRLHDLRLNFSSVCQPGVQISRWSRNILVDISEGISDIR